MAFITLRQANVVTSPNATIKGSPLTNSEVDNNFANINIEVVSISTAINNLSSSAISNGTSSIAIEENANIIITGNLVPSLDATYNLGSADKRFNQLFLTTALSITNRYQTANTDEQPFATIVANTYPAGEVLVEMLSGGERHITKLHYVKNTTAVVFTQFGDVFSDVSLGNINLAINGSNIDFLVSAVNATTNVNAKFDLLEF